MFENGNLKIALVTPYDWAYPGGVNNHVSHLRNVFVRRGHEVKIIAPSSLPPEDSSDGNLIIVDKAKPWRWGTGGSTARVSTSAKLFFSNKIKKLLEKENFDIIHLHEPFLPAVCSTVIRYSKTVNVGTFHAYHGSNQGYVFWKPLFNFWFKKLNAKIAVSRPAMEFVSQYYPGDYTIIPNGVDVEQFSNNSSFEKKKDGKLNILFVGRLEERKGPLILLQAYEQLKGEFQNLCLTFVGPDGGLKEECEAFIRERDLKDVFFAGFVSDEELPRYYKNCDVFCSSAIGRESFGIVLLEAMAAGKPVVASNIEGYAEVITSEVEGLLVKPNDKNALADALRILLRDKALRDEMGVAGRLKAKEYSWERVGQKIMDVYQKALNKY